MKRKTSKAPITNSGDMLTQSQERYKAFIEQSTEGIWRCELEKPISIKWTTKKQIDHCFKYAYLAECNDAMARMYGFLKASEIVGARLNTLMIPTDPQNIAYLKAFVKSNYQLSNVESRELDRYGNIRIFENSLIGIVNNGYLWRAWGTQRDVTEQKLQEERQQFFEKVTAKLVSSLNHHVTLQEIAQLIVPYFADYTRIAVVDNDNIIKEIAVNHTDPKKVMLAQELFESYKDLPTSQYGVPNILHTGKSEIMSVINDAVLDKYKMDKKVVAIVKRLGLRSYMGVPLIARNKIIGAITFSSVQEHRQYTKKDLPFAEELARRIALTLENIRLFTEAKEELRERKRIAESLRDEQERLQLAQEAGHLGVFDWDIKNDKVKWTPQLEKMHGLDAGTFKGTFKAYLQLIHPEDRKRIEIEFKEQIKKSPQTEFEFRIVHPDNTVRWIYSKARVFFDKRKKPVRTVGINIDITERMQQRINLQFLANAGKILGSSLDYQTTLNQVAKIAVPQIADWCGIDILDDKGELQQIAVVHKDPQKIKLAKEIRKKYPPDLKAKNGLGKILRTGKPELYTYIDDEMLKLGAKDATHLQYLKKVGLKSLMIVPLVSAQKPIGAITFVSSMPKRQFTTSDLAIAQELAHRTSLAIENARLYKNAQEAIALRDDFISVASHELKTPITSVKIFTQVLQKHAVQNADEKATQNLGKMDKQIDKLTELVYNLLNITKIQSGQMEFSRKNFSFDQMVSDVVDVLQHMTNRHKLIIVGKTNKIVKGDEDRIGQVVSNLISNAIKYSPHADKVVITLTAKRNQIGVSVQDFGIGMAKQHLDKIFNRFYRISGATDKTFPGLGIGLYISKEIIERHGGKMWAESETGKGSTFYFTLPLISHKNESIPQPVLKN